MFDRKLQIQNQEIEGVVTLQQTQEQSPERFHQIVKGELGEKHIIGLYESS